MRRDILMDKLFEVGLQPIIPQGIVVLLRHKFTNPLTINLRIILSYII